MSTTNRAPNIGPDSNAILTFTEGGEPIRLLAGAFVSDPDAPAHFQGGSLHIQITGGVQSGDRLTLAAGSGFVEGGGVIRDELGNRIGTLSGLGSGRVTVSDLSDYATAESVGRLLQAFAFQATSENPTASRTITFTFSDGGHGAFAPLTDSVSQAVQIVPVADAPSGTDVSRTLAEEGYYTLRSSDFGFSDVDGGRLASIVFTTVPSKGVILVNSVPVKPGQEIAASLIDQGAVVYYPPLDGAGQNYASFTFQVRDNASTDNGGINLDPTPNNFTFHVTEYNDTPFAGSPTSYFATYVENAPPLALFQGVVLRDVDNPVNLAGATLTVAATGSGGAIGLAPGGGFYLSGEGPVLALMHVGLSAQVGTISWINPTSLTVAFNHSATMEVANQLANGFAYSDPSETLTGGARSLTMTFNDGGNVGIGGARSSSTYQELRLQGVNDPPSAEAPAAQTVAAGEALVFSAPGGNPVRITDPDSGSSFVNVQISAPDGTLHLAATSGLGSVSGDGTAVVTLSGTLAAVNSALDGLSYRPALGAGGNKLLTLKVWDSGTAGGSATATRTIRVDVTAVAKDDLFAIDENQALSGNLFEANGAGGPDLNPESTPLEIAAVNGSAASVGQTIRLASGATLTVQADGRFTYDPGTAFLDLTGRASGAVNTGTRDSFTYTLKDGSTATARIDVNGIVSSEDKLLGDVLANSITGTAGADLFMLGQGGDDKVAGLGGKDAFIFGSALTAADRVDGGAEVDQMSIQGDYSGARALTLGNVVNVEQIILLAGNDTRFGDSGTSHYSYDIALADSTVGAGQVLQVDGSRLRAGENFSFDGSAETNGAVTVFGGKGVDRLTGGSGHDGFIFKGTGNWGAADRIDGGGGTDQLGIRGNYTGARAIVMGAEQIEGIEQMILMSGTDIRFGPAIGDVDYDVTMDDGNVASGQCMTVDAASLRGGESLVFNGSAETDGSYRVFGGRDSDSITGGHNGDSLRGGAGGDRLAGGGGRDIFVYRNAGESTGPGFDTLLDFDGAEDRIELPGAVSGWAAGVEGGRLSAATFDADLSALLDGVLEARQAVLFRPDEGEHKGSLFLVVDGNGDGAYTAGADFVFALGPTASLEAGAAIFI